MTRLLAISGSLRAASSNTALLQHMKAVAPRDVEIELYDAIGALPHFNPDLDGDSPPPVVAEFRARLQAADAVLIRSPEYAHGVPGTMKNALDCRWCSSTPSLPIELWGKSAADPDEVRAALARVLEEL